MERRVVTRRTDGVSAAGFLPPRRTLPALRTAAAPCRGCPLWTHATQTVFGEGPARARVMLVGEQPGHDEDLAGRRSEEHTSELQSHVNLVCRLLLEKKKK